jgi:hypothetical protein
VRVESRVVGTCWTETTVVSERTVDVDPGAVETDIMLDVTVCVESKVRVVVWVVRRTEVIREVNVWKAVDTEVVVASNVVENESV